MKVESSYIVFNPRVVAGDKLQVDSRMVFATISGSRRYVSGYVSGSAMYDSSLVHNVKDMYDARNIAEAAVFSNGAWKVGTVHTIESTSSPGTDSQPSEVASIALGDIPDMDGVRAFYIRGVQTEQWW